MEAPPRFSPCLHNTALRLTSPADTVKMERQRAWHTALPLYGRMRYIQHSTHARGLFVAPGQPTALTPSAWLPRSPCASQLPPPATLPAYHTCNRNCTCNGRDRHGNGAHQTLLPVGCVLARVLTTASRHVAGGSSACGPLAYRCTRLVRDGRPFDRRFLQLRSVELRERSAEGDQPAAQPRSTGQPWQLQPQHGEQPHVVVQWQPVEALNPCARELWSSTPLLSAAPPDSQTAVERRHVPSLLCGAPAHAPACRWAYSSSVYHARYSRQRSGPCLGWPLPVTL